MGYYANVGGSFAADGAVFHFGTSRSKPTSGPDCAFEVIYSEMYNPGSGAILAANANSRWRMALRNQTTGRLYWSSKGLYNIWSFGGIPAGTYRISCQSYNNETKPPQLTPRIRFNGNLTIR